MRKIHAAALGLALAGGSFVVTEVPAAAKAYCERYTQAPAFYSGATIDAYYYVTCSQSVSQATLYGRLKEDRSSAPDVVLDTESITFRNKGTTGDHVTTSSCQNGDLISSEAQINSETPTTSSRRQMSS